MLVWFDGNKRNFIRALGSLRYPDRDAAGCEYDFRASAKVDSANLDCVAAVISVPVRK
jgi:hypothetical protein